VFAKYVEPCLLFPLLIYSFVNSFSFGDSDYFLWGLFEVDFVFVSKDKMVRTYSTHGRGEMNVYRVLLGRPEEKRPLGKPRRRWKDNIKMDLREVG
jgi:hypothetical protein